jgi:hypothetical protein
MLFVNYCQSFFVCDTVRARQVIQVTTIRAKWTVVKFHRLSSSRTQRPRSRTGKRTGSGIQNRARSSSEGTRGRDTEAAAPGGRGAGRRAACEYFTRVSPRQRAGQREGEHGSHGGEHGHAAAEGPGAPRPRSGCRAPAVAMETHGPGRAQLADRDPSQRCGPSLAERRAQPAPASGLAGPSAPYLRPPGRGGGDGGRTPARLRSLLGVTARGTVSASVCFEVTNHKGA